ncbi:MAG: bifunctional SulP family inorganic anion transporter/carbonic anhydrase [Planctomyces sp.]|nr:bifunctional SulP family inorganic anion transporter/carbonic anhydrase [Planctomyces sp.]
MGAAAQMSHFKINRATLSADLLAGAVVFLVALPLCLGIAQASGAPLIAGLVSGIIGGLLVGALSGSHTSVSGPAAGLTAVVASQITELGSFEALLSALIVAGVIQIVLGMVRAGGMSAFVPSSVIHGLLSAIGVILILKQVPHIFGHDSDPEGDLSFVQPDHENTFTELYKIVGDLHSGATIIGLVSIGLLLIWDQMRLLKKTRIPAPFAVVILGVILEAAFRHGPESIVIGMTHLVNVPVSGSPQAFFSLLHGPDWSLFTSLTILPAAVTIAIVASLETLLNLEAIDQIDPERRQSPPNRELIAQGVGNLVAGIAGGLPMTSVIVRSSVNLNAGGKTRVSAIFHGFLLLVCVVFLTPLLNRIPIASLAAILLVTGVKLASPSLVQRMWKRGWSQFVPFVVTVVAIVFTDLLQGVLIGLGASIAFILNNNLRQTVRQDLQKHPGGDVLRIQLPEQVTFLNRATIDQTLRGAPRGSHLLIDAGSTDYIDPDVLGLIREFRDDVAPRLGLNVSLSGFRDSYHINDRILFSDVTTREIQDQLTPAQVLDLLYEGNRRFLSGRQLTRNLTRQLTGAALGQHPLAVILSCIDSRSPAELIFDLGIGDVLNVRIAGNVISPKVLGSLEYSCQVAGARLILVMGHTKCGAVTAAVQFASSKTSCAEVTGCQHLEPILSDIQRNMSIPEVGDFARMNDPQKEILVNRATEQNVERIVTEIVSQSTPLNSLVEHQRIAIVGAILDVATGCVKFLPNAMVGLNPSACPATDIN